MSKPRTQRGRARRSRSVLTLAVVGGIAWGCASSSGEATGGPMSKGQADREIRRSIRSSSEGVILLPSRKAEAQYDLTRLNELAQSLRQPAAACFIERAIETMQRDPGADRGYRGVPDGQVKLRVRLSPDGRVMRAEVLESGFTDESVPQCFARVLERMHWPENRTGVMHHVDVIWWVSLGAHADLESPDHQARLRRETAEAAVRAKRCFDGRVAPGRFEVEGLNLVTSDGASITSRVTEDDLPEPVRACVARALRDLRLPHRSDAFLRPVSTTLRFDVEADGVVRVEDEEWLHLVQLEERARRAEQAALLREQTLDGSPGQPEGEAVDLVGSGEVDLGPAPEDEGDDEVETTAEAPNPEPPPRPAIDPGRGGLKLDLGARTRGDR